MDLVEVPNVKPNIFLCICAEQERENKQIVIRIKSLFMILTLYLFAA